jgi:hypothetical protein
MREGAIPKKRPVPMTPPILQATVSWSGGAVSAEGYAPDHSNMTILQLANEGGVNLGRFCL